MSLIDEITEIQLEMYNAKLMVMRQELKDNGIEITEAEVSDRAHAILSGDTQEHTYTRIKQEGPPVVESADE